MYLETAIEEIPGLSLQEGDLMYLLQRNGEVVAMFVRPTGKKHNGRKVLGTYSGVSVGSPEEVAKHVARLHGLEAKKMPPIDGSRLVSFEFTAA